MSRVLPASVVVHVRYVVVGVGVRRLLLVHSRRSGRGFHRRRRRPRNGDGGGPDHVHGELGSGGRGVERWRCVGLVFDGGGRARDPEELPCSEGGGVGVGAASLWRGSGEHISQSSAVSSQHAPAAGLPPCGFGDTGASPPPPSSLRPCGCSTRTGAPDCCYLAGVAPEQVRQTAVTLRV